MFEISNKNISADLRALSKYEMHLFIEKSFPQNKLTKLRLKIKSVENIWPLLDRHQRIEKLNELQDILLDGLCPNAPVGIYYPEDTDKRTRIAYFSGSCWKIFFIYSHLIDNRFHVVFGTLLHECFHGLLHFMSACTNRQLSQEFLRPPYYIMQQAYLAQIKDENIIARKLARKNLLGIIDRWGISRDSYNLNVEITVDTLSEILYLKLNCFQFGYQRGYPEAEIYFKNRIQGYSSHKSIKSFS